MSYGQDKCTKESSGWEDDPRFDEYDEKFRGLNNKIINLANKKVTLYSILKHYNLISNLESDLNGWLPCIQCPFQDHNDSTPSFGFNYTEDRFYCFGCKKSGRAVQFISYMEGVGQIDVAKKLLPINFKKEEINYTDVVDLSEIKKILFEYADCVRSFLIRNECKDQAFEYINNLNWNLDVYMSSAFNFSSLNYNNLEARIYKLKEFIELYQDK